VLQCYVLTCGRSVTAFSGPPRSQHLGQGPRSRHPKAGPGSDSVPCDIRSTWPSFPTTQSTSAYVTASVCTRCPPALPPGFVSAAMLRTNHFCGLEVETVQHITCHCEALARKRYNVFGSLAVEPTDIRTATVKDLCLFIRGTGLWNLGLI
jgi:hypothetical protein